MVDLIERVNLVWEAAITYVPIARGFLYLVAAMDRVARYVLTWRLSNLLDASFCIEALEETLSEGRSEIFNTNQRSESSITTSPAPVRAWRRHQYGWARPLRRQPSNGAGAASSMRR